MAEDTNEVQAAAEHFLHALDNLDWERFVACWSSEPTAFYPGDDTRVRPATTPNAVGRAR